MGVFNDGFMPTSINANTFNDFNKIQYQPGAYTVGTNEVILYLFSPQGIPYQVARPFVYQFTPEFVDTVKNGPTLASAVGPMGSKSDSVMKAILPDATGMVLNTGNMQHMWSFVLIIDSGNDRIGTIIRPGIRKVAIGYVSDEPGIKDPITGEFKINPTAVLMFTHSSTLNIKRSAGATSDGLSVYASQDVDYANDTTAMMFDDKIMLGTPREILNHAVAMRNNPTGITDYSSIDLSVVKQGSNDTKLIDNSIKAPRHQLSDIMTAIDNGIEVTTQEQPIMSRFTDNDDMYSPPHERAFNSSMNNMPSSTGLTFTMGLDTSRPISMSELDNMFPNMKVFPFIMPVNGSYGWDSSNQAAVNGSGMVSPVVSPRNQMSFLVSAVTQAVCSQLGIAQVAYEYSSRVVKEFAIGTQDAFAFRNYQLIVPRAPAVEEQSALAFKTYLYNQLFDVIRSVVGDFEVHVIANMGGDILINLILYNFPDPEDGTYFQTSARLGGMMNPMLANLDTINNNVLQLSGMTETLIGNSFNNSSFNTGMFSNNDGMMPSAF